MMVKNENRLMSFKKKLDKNKTNTEILLQKKCIEKFKIEQSRYHFSLIKTQLVIGWYIVDFLFPHKHLIVEIDGSQHFSLSGRTDDFIRDEYLKSLGFDVLRYSNKDVYKNIDDIVDYIDLWACCESPVRNMFKSKEIIKKQNELKKSGQLERISKGSDFF